MLHDIVIFHCHRAHVPAIHSVSHVDHEKRVTCFSISMHACGCVPIVMVLHLAARDLLLTKRQQVDHPYVDNLYFPPLFPPPQPAGHMLIAQELICLLCFEQQCLLAFYCVPAVFPKYLHVD